MTKPPQRKPTPGRASPAQFPEVPRGTPSGGWWGRQLNFLAGAAVDSARFHPVRGSRSATSDRVWPVHCFNFPRLAAVLVTAIVVFVACAQGPGTPGPPDTAPSFADTVATRPTRKARQSAR